MGYLKILTKGVTVDLILNKYDDDEYLKVIAIGYVDYQNQMLPLIWRFLGSVGLGLRCRLV